MENKQPTHNLTNEQIDRVFGMYMPCTVLCGKQSGWTLSQKTYPANLRFYVENYLRIKALLLTPLSAISDEDANEVRNIIWGCEIRRRNIVNIQYVVENLWHTDLAMGTAFLIYQYLIQQGYAVPLFIAPNHPDNGKTAIELGLAIDKTKTPQ